ALDGQEFSEEAVAFTAWCANTTPIPVCVTDLPLFEPFPVYIYTHTAQWIEARATLTRAEAPSVWIEALEPIEPGTSGSPIVTSDGALVGIVSIAGTKIHDWFCHGPNPRPSLALPVWVMRRMQAAQDLEE